MHLVYKVSQKRQFLFNTQSSSRCGVVRAQWYLVHVTYVVMGYIHNGNRLRHILHHTHHATHAVICLEVSFCILSRPG